VDVTVVTLAPQALTNLESLIALDDVDEEEAPPSSSEPEAVPILYDDDAAVDEPTGIIPLILVSAVGQTDRGKRRRRNEDSYLVLENVGLFAIADGMGGYAGGEVASWIATDTVADAFRDNEFKGAHYPEVPRRGSELALAMQMANAAVHEQATQDRELENMGTTMVCARFSPNKQRLYVGHVGDSRCYRLRGNELRQMTTDHTMAAEGFTGLHADHLTRAVGIAPTVKIDLIIARPRPDDVYVLCSDGLSKMIPDSRLRDVLVAEPDPKLAVKKLIEAANEGGGKDNITVVLVRVRRPGLSDFDSILKPT
jgi:protein phosphatase